MAPETQRHTRRVAIMGTSVTSGNRGVLALGTSLVGLCMPKAQDNELSFLVGHYRPDTVRMRPHGEDCTVTIVPCRWSPKSAPRDHLLWIVTMALLYRLVPIRGFRRMLSRRTPWIKTIEEADLVGDIRGGDSFSDIYGMPRFLEGFLIAWTVLLVKGTMVQFPQTYGPYKSGLARRLARFLLLRSSRIIARDLQSQRVAQDLVGNRKQVDLSPDVAFSLKPIMPSRIILDPPRDGSAPVPVIGLNVNGLMYHGGYTRKNMFGLRLDYAALLPPLIVSLLNESNAEIWLIPHTYGEAGNVESDPEAGRQVRESLPPELRSRVRLVAPEYDQHEIKGIIGTCDFFIGSRMHACIAALSQGVPCIGVAYSMKFAGVFESVGMREWVLDGREFANEAAIKRILELYRQRAAVRDPLAAKATEARTKLQALFTELLSNGRSPA